MITWKTLVGVNTAGLLDTRPDIMEVIDCALEAFCDDLVPNFLSKNDSFTITYEIVNETLTFAWNWKSRDLHNTQAFRYSPISETAEEFIAKVKAYFFDLCVMISNL